MADAISCMSREVQSSTLEFDAVNFAPQVSTQRRGQLAIEIKQEPLSFLLEEGFKVSSTTQHFCGPTCTIERRMAAYGHSQYLNHCLLVLGPYSNISDGQLDNLVSKAQGARNGIGLRVLMGYRIVKVIGFSGKECVNHF
ncbi:unnamed protein product [Porites lobata]|uniref:Uncharacterized protein n=1 Tax=Porites lobata TaxID=104759 RepID=A0ABN8PC03_9CNID|nr:unnamed protein product [Porites lobata]